MAIEAAGFNTTNLSVGDTYDGYIVTELIDAPTGKYIWAKDAPVSTSQAAAIAQKQKYHTSQQSTTNLNTLYTTWAADSSCLEIVIDSPVVCNTNVTIAKPVRFLNGGVITGTATITFSSRVEAPRAYVFQQTGVVLSSSSTAVLYPEWFGVDGSSDVTPFTKAVQAAVASGRPLQVDSAVDLSALGSAINLTGSITMRGMGTITGPSTSMVLFEVNNNSAAKIICDQLNFSTFDTIFNFQGNTSYSPYSFSSYGCKINNVGRGFVGSGGGVYWDADFITISNCRITNSGKTVGANAYAINLSLRNCRSVSVLDCTIETVGSLSNTSQVGAILVDFSGASDSSQSATVSHNRIYSVKSGTNSGTDQVFGIMCLDCHCSVAGNVVDTILAPNHPSSPEGIYTKCSKSIVASNSILDCPGREGCINMKGESSGDYSSEKSMCSGNIIGFRSTPTEACIGIGLSAPNISCVGNVIQYTKGGIASAFDAVIANNVFIGVQQWGVQVTPYLTGLTTIIKGNTFKDIGLVSEANVWGVLYNSTGSFAPKLLEVTDNTFVNFAGTTTFGMRLILTSSAALENFVCKNNYGHTMTQLVNVNATATNLITYIEVSNNTGRNLSSIFANNVTAPTAKSVEGNVLDGVLWSGNDAGATVANATDAASVIARLNDLLATLRTRKVIAT